jgi:hypothetical protein
MPMSTEFTITMEDKPGMLGECCQELAEYGANIIAFEAFEQKGEGLIRMVADDPQKAKKALDNRYVEYTEQEVAQTTMANRPGELGRAALRLGNADINIRYAYCGTDPSSGAPLLIFGVSDVAKAVTLLDELAEEEIKAA